MKKMVQSLTRHISEQASMEAVVVQGEPIACIVDRANKMNYDLVVMGTKGATGLKEIFLGSVTSTILKKVNIPILAVPAKFQFEQIKTIVLAVDQQGLQQEATIRPLIDLAKAVYATINIYHLVEEDETSDLDIAPAIDLLLQEVPHTFHTEVKSMSVNEAINAFVKTQQADLLCMIRRKKTFWDRLFFESSTKKEVFDSPVPPISASGIGEDIHSLNRQPMNRLLMLLCFPFLTSTCAELDIEQEMVQFDATFVPTWYHTYKQDGLRANTANETMMQQWQQLKTDYQYIIGPAVDWQETYNGLDELFEQASQAIANQDLSNALNYLEGIRFEWMALRQRYDIPYYLDKIWVFQSAYDIVRQFAHPDCLFITEWHDFDCLVEEMNLAWAEVVAGKPNQNWNTTKQQQFEALKNSITAQVQKFDAIVKTASIEANLLYSNIVQIEPLLLFVDSALWAV
ncbi:MAG: universal stress protein [Saprospiraceae bacterium]|nr:universal stress protein [Saprospiraceae bacterium]